MVPARRVWPLLGTLLLALAFAGCEDPIEPSDVAGGAVWSDGERAEYVLLDGDDEVGRAEFSVARDGDTYLLTQMIVTDQVTDRVTVHVRDGDLKPRSARRVIDGDGGYLEIDSSYEEEDGRVILHAFDGEERESSSNDLPEHVYDTRQNLFLWRTLPLAEDYEVAYRGMLSTIARKPNSFTVTVRVRELEKIVVPAGVFDTWRVRATVTGSVETAWIAVDPPHPVVRFDNGTRVFELVLFDP